VKIAQAQAEFDVINDRLRSSRRLSPGEGARMIGLEQNIRGGFRAAFSMLSAAVACVLLIACVNLSNLLLVGLVLSSFSRPMWPRLLCRR
jgi:hypothetical protein